MIMSAMILDNYCVVLSAEGTLGVVTAAALKVLPVSYL